MLEETGLAYEPHLIDISNNESKDPAFVSLNPNGRIPAIIDPAGPDGRPIALWESGAILLYLADKTGQFISTEPGQRYETLAWVFFQMSAIGPMFGQLGFFPRFGGKDYEDKRPQQRFIDESTRLLGILDRRLEGRDRIVDDYSIADIATLGWVNALVEFYAAGDILASAAFRTSAHGLDAGWLDRPSSVASTFPRGQHEHHRRLLLQRRQASSRNRAR